ncbi:hypothetical protein EVAR_76411_1 [Eumeta japonica]|uniref:Uncharacterized protein n=1 Tax=Eumeta variegata TaxID=151549 RepID=A0A4C1TAS6_EUMVA|nr:hypothetical protein EVAR_76411_1 [Eumeta japonica]
MIIEFLLTARRGPIHAAGAPPGASPAPIQKAKSARLNGCGNMSFLINLAQSCNGTHTIKSLSMILFVDGYGNQISKIILPNVSSHHRAYSSFAGARHHESASLGSLLVRRNHRCLRAKLVSEQATRPLVTGLRHRGRGAGVLYQSRLRYLRLLAYPLPELVFFHDSVIE